MSAPSTSQPTLLRLIRALAIIVICISGYLLIQKARGEITSLIGCGGKSGCSQVLGGRWSQWFGIPVPVFSTIIYIAVFFFALPQTMTARPRQASIALQGAAILAIGAAIWFFSILLFVEKAFCAYCTATHICGIAFAVIVFVLRGRTLPNVGAAPIAAGIIGTAALATGQLMGPAPDTHRITDTSSTGPASAKPAAQGSKLSFLDGMIRVDPASSPSVGPPNAPHTLVELFDYTCGSCRDMHGDLAALRKAYPETFRIIYFPCPLNRRCNPFLLEGVKDHQHACELAESALTVWQADPEKFPEMHHYLMTSPLPIPPEDARAKGISLVGKEAFEAAEGSAVVSSLMTESFGHYAAIAQKTGAAMPKLLLGEGKVLSGIAKSTSVFVNTLAKNFKLPAPTNTAP